MSKQRFLKAISILLLPVLGLAFFPAELAYAAMAEEVPVDPLELNERLSYSKQVFIISAYYSPQPGQSRYSTGTYEGDIRLNGNGTNGADGTPVYPGMIAAPPEYAFGTVMYIPGVGTVRVNDRGGAIKSAGFRGNAYDRLDIWMGYGDAGLTRALNWGKRTVEVTVYGVNPDIPTEVVFSDSYDPVHIVTEVPEERIFSTDLGLGTKGDEVTLLQEQLYEMGYLKEVTGFYSYETASAVYQFQLAYNIVSSDLDLGAGYFGPTTRSTLEAWMEGELTAGDPELPSLPEVQAPELSTVSLEKYPDLYEPELAFIAPLQYGARGESVIHLQEELGRLGYFGVEPTGVYDELTQHAVFKFQQSQGLVLTWEDAGAGYLGPKTRETLNHLIEERYQAKLEWAYNRAQLENSEQEAEDKTLLATLPEQD